MPNSSTQWEPSWDDDWRAAQRQLEEEIEEEHPHNPDQAVEMYRFGFTAAHRVPLPVWSDIESELYGDYMAGAPEPGSTETEEEQREMTWEQSRDWAERGWGAGHSHHQRLNTIG